MKGKKIEDWLAIVECLALIRCMLIVGRSIQEVAVQTESIIWQYLAQDMVDNDQKYVAILIMRLYLLTHV